MFSSIVAAQYAWCGWLQHEEETLRKCSEKSGNFTVPGECLPVFLYGSECWAHNRSARPVVPSNVAGHQMVPLCLEWWCSEANKATETHCDNPGTLIYPTWAHCTYRWQCRPCIMLALPQGDWRRPPGRPLITWLSTILYDLRCHNLTLPEVVDMAQNRPLWRLLSLSGATQC